MTKRKLHPAIEAALALTDEALTPDVALAAIAEDAFDSSLELLAEDAGNVDDEEQADFELRTNSVVKTGYKVLYRTKADAMARRPKGVPLKALRRMTGDWLAVELAKATLDEKAKLVVPKFEAVLDANGVKHSHWNRTTKGWQGRLRMTGRLALERLVAAAGELALPNGSTVKAPRNWVAAHQR